MVALFMAIMSMLPMQSAFAKKKAKAEVAATNASTPPPAAPTCLNGGTISVKESKAMVFFSENRRAFVVGVRVLLEKDGTTLPSCNPLFFTTKGTIEPTSVSGGGAIDSKGAMFLRFDLKDGEEVSNIPPIEIVLKKDKDDPGRTVFIVDLNKKTGDPEKSETTKK